MKKQETNLENNSGSGRLHKLEIRGANDEYSDSFSSDDSSQDDSDHLENQTTQGSPRVHGPETNIGNEHSKTKYRRSSLLAQSYQEDYDFSKVKLYVIKMMPHVRSSTSLSLMNSNRNAKHQHQCEYFKMKIDPERCDPESNNDQDLRVFKRRVRERFGFPENFRLFNQQGHAIQDFELSIINQDERGCGVVYVSPPNTSFDFETYIQMFRELKKLGEGGFGQVILSQHLITKEKYAIKSIQPYVHKADEVSKVFKEALVLQKLNHPNVIRLFNVFQLPDTRIIFFMEYLRGGSLADHLKNFEGERVKESAAQKIMYEVTCAINFCHQRQIVHRDIKLENIMLREKGDVSSGLVIIDFGIAGQLQRQKEKQNEGTIRYAPPELVSSKNLAPDTQFDVWSLGILLYRLLSGIFPFDGKTFGEIRNKIIKDEPDFSEAIFSDLSDTCIALIKLMLSKDSNQRPRLNQLILHPWFQTSKHQQTLMNMTMFQNNQNTMMNFFKQELQNVEAQRKKIDETPLTAAASNNQQLIIVDENEQQQYSPSLMNYNHQRTINQRGSLQYQNNFSPPGKLVLNRIQIDQIEKFTIVPNRVQGTAENNKGRAIETAMSLSTKKQKLNDIRSLKPPQFDSVSMDREINSNDVQESLDKLSMKMMIIKKRQQQFQSHQRNENLKSIQDQNSLKQNSSHQRSSVLTQHSNQSQMPPQTYFKQKDSIKPSKFSKKINAGNSHHGNQKSIEIFQETELPRIGQQAPMKFNGVGGTRVPAQLNEIFSRIINKGDESPTQHDSSISPTHKNHKIHFDSFANKNKSTISNRASPHFNYHQQSQDSNNLKAPFQGSLSRIAKGGVVMNSIELNESQKKKKHQTILYQQAQDIQINELSINKQSNFKQAPNEFRIQRMKNNSNLQLQSQEMMMPQGENKQQPQSIAKIQLKIIS